MQHKKHVHYLIN